MSHDTTVYDLGDVDPSPVPASAMRPTVMRPRPERPAVRVGYAAPPAGVVTYITDTLSLVLPGSGRILRGEWASGAFVISSVAFLFTFGWAVVETLDRLNATLPLLALPREAGVWALGVVYAALSMVHVGNLLDGVDEATALRRGAHPVVAGMASAIVPGWGQLLNGQRVKSASFVGALWIVGASWILVSPPARELLVAFDMHLPPALLVFCSPVVRWTLPAVVWALSVYDAISGGSSE